MNVTTAPESLHLLAHHAQQRARTADDWWDSPFDTALAAVSSTRHPVSFRDEGLRALKRLQRWASAEGPRRVSADAAALALAARAASDLAHRDRELETAAVAALGDLASRAPSAVPALHLALSVWALDPILEHRSTAPWQEIRIHQEMLGTPRGLDSPLRTFTEALSAETFAAADLVRSLLAQIPLSPGLEDSVVLVWLATVAIERCAPEMRSDDSGLKALIDRRTELADRLAQEIGPGDFEHPEVPDFDPEAELDLRPTVYLSPTEALLLDISLSSTEPDRPWIRFEEGQDLFGRRAAAAEDHLTRRSVGFISVIGLLAGALVVASLADRGAHAALAFSAGAIPLAVALVWSSILWRRRSPTRLNEAFGLLAVTALLAAAFESLNQALAHPLVPDATGLLIGAFASPVAVVVFLVLMRTGALSRDEN